MARKENETDRFIGKLLDDAGIETTEQYSPIKPIADALQTASKKLNGKMGAPDFVGVVKDYLIIVEDKQDLSHHVHYQNDDEKSGVVDIDNADAVMHYAMNGGLHYAEHILARTSYKKAFVFGASGDEAHHKITPMYVDERDNYQILPDVESFISFNADNIDRYYVTEVLHDNTDEQKDTAELLKSAAKLNEDLRNYGNLQDTQKPLVVSAILLALREQEHHGFSLDDLNGDKLNTDGTKILEAVKNNLKRTNVSPETKRDKILGQFDIIKSSPKLNEVNDKLGMTPLKYYAEYLEKTIYRNIRYTQSSEDYLGRFYGEFMSYSGGDGQSLGIILTPKHITETMCDLVHLKNDDVVLDPTCGTGGFLVAAMHQMLAETPLDDTARRQHIRKNQLLGIELQEYMFTIATTNMILRGDGKSNLYNEDFLKFPADKLQLKEPTVGLMNPPYSQGSKKDPSLYEISFIEHLLDSLLPGARAAVIVPQSTMIGGTKIEKVYKENILKHHTLEGVITCNEHTFYGVGTNPVIAVFTAHEPQLEHKKAKFIDFRNDGYVVRKHVGLVDDGTATDKYQHMLDVFDGKVTVPAKFMVESEVKPTDEWLHSFYHFNDEIPSDEDFMKTIDDYLSFKFTTEIHKN